MESCESSDPARPVIFSCICIAALPGVWTLASIPTEVANFKGGLTYVPRWAPNSIIRIPMLTSFDCTSGVAFLNSKMPNAMYFKSEAGPGTLELTKALQGQGELLDYSLEELTAHDFAVLWRKPA